MQHFDRTQSIFANLARHISYQGYAN